MKKFFAIIMSTLMIVCFMPSMAFAAHEYEASIGDETSSTTYQTLEAAIRAAKAGDTITLLKDVETDKALTVTTNGAVTIDLDGRTITRNVKQKNQTDGTDLVCAPLVVDGASTKLTLTDGSSAKTGKIISTGSSNEGTAVNSAVFVRGGELILDGPTLEVSSDSTRAVGVYLGGTEAATSFTMEKGKINVTATETGTAVGVAVNGGKGTSYKATFNMVSGEIAATTESEDLTASGVDIEGYGKTAEDTSAEFTMSGGSISSNGIGINSNSDHGGTKITISGGKITGNVLAIYHPQKGELEIEGGTLTGLGGIEMKAGSATISGQAKITATKETPYSYPENSGNDTAGYAVALVKSYYTNVYNGNGSMKIKGGTFTGPVAVIEETDAETSKETEKQDDQLEITSGKFSVDPIKYLKSNYTSTLGVKSGLYEINNRQMVAEVDGTMYDSLTEAVTVAKGGYPVCLVSDIKSDQKIQIDDGTTATIDLWGHTIKRTNGNITYDAGQVVSAVFVNGGNLTVKDTKGSGAIVSELTGTDGNGCYGTGVLIRNGGNFTLESGNIRATAESSKTVGVWVDAEGAGNETTHKATFTMDGGSVTTGTEKDINVEGGEDKTNNAVVVTGRNAKPGEDGSNCAVFTLNNGTITALAKSAGTKYDEGTGMEMDNPNDLTCGTGNGVQVTGGTDNNGSNTTGIFKMTGGKIDGQSYGINGDSDYAGTKITISGGEINGKVMAIYHPQVGTLDISGGTITGLSGIEMKGGHATLSGSTKIVVEGEHGGTESWEEQTKGNSTSQWAVVAVNNTEYSDNVTIDIAGGDYTGTIGVWEDNGSWTNKNNFKVNITGGTFTNIPWEHMAESTKDGYVVEVTTRNGSDPLKNVYEVKSAESHTHKHLKETKAKAATCEADGNNAYYTCTDCGKILKADKTTETTVAAETIKATGHTYVTKQRKEPTCTDTGLTEGSECNVCKKVFVKQETIPALGHKFGDWTYAWTNTEDEVNSDSVNETNTCTATRTCERLLDTDGKTCKHTETVQVTATGKKVEPTCENTGGMTYTADFSEENKKLGTNDKKLAEQKKVVIITALGHDLTKTDAVAAACTTGGNEAYWTCGREACKKVFSDKQGTEETTVDRMKIDALGHKMTKTEAKAATCTEPGNNAYYTCNACEKVFSDEKGKAETTAEAQALKATGHNLTHVAAKESTSSAEGNYEYWYCENCKKYFKDSAAKTEYAENAWKIAKKSSSTSGGSGSSSSGGGGGYVAPGNTTNTAGTTTTATKPSTTTTNGVSKVTAALSASEGATMVSYAVTNKSTEIVLNAATGTAVKEAGAGTAAEITIPAATLSQIVEKTNAGLTIKSDIANVALDAAAVEAVAAKAGQTGNVKLIVNVVENSDAKIEVELKIQTAAGDVTDFGGGAASVTVKLGAALAAKDLASVYVSDAGVYSKVTGQKNADATYTFTTGHFSSYEVLPEEKADKLFEAQAGRAAELTSALSLKASSEKTAKGAIKVTLAVDEDAIGAIEDLGYTVKYRFYRSTKKAASYKAKYEKAEKTYTNTQGTKGTRYYYKARVMVYDSEGTLVAKSALTQCRYACRIK